MAYYIQKSILKTRDQFSKPDNFVNLNALIEEVADAGNPDLSALQDDITDLQTDLGTVQTDITTIENAVSAVEAIATTHIVSLSPTKTYSTAVNAGDIDAFIVPAELNGYVLAEVRLRHYQASIGSTGNTTVNISRNSISLLNVTGNIAAGSLSASPATDQTEILATGDFVIAFVSSTVIGGTPPNGLYVTLVFKPAP